MLPQANRSRFSSRKTPLLRSGVFLVLAAFLFAPLISFAQAERSYDYADISVTYHVNADSTVQVEETQTYEFAGKYHQGERVIPQKGTDAITDISVFDAVTGEPLAYSSLQLDKTRPDSWGKYTTYTQNGSTYIDWYYDLSDTSHTWIIRYTLHGAISFYKDYDELYWNLFTSYTVPVKEAEATVVLPGPDTLPAATFYVKGEHGVVSSRPDDRTFTFKAFNFAPQEAVTVAVGWQKGLVSHEAYWLDFLSLNWPYVASVFLFLAALLIGAIHRYVIHSQRSGRTIIPEYEPPAGITPALAEFVAKEDSTTRAWPATTVDLAVRGFLTIKELPKEGWLARRTDYELMRTDLPAEGILPYERAFLDGLFINGTSLSMKEVRQSQSAQASLQVALASARKALLTDAGNTAVFEHTPNRDQQGRVLILLAILAPLMALFLVALAHETLWPLLQPVLRYLVLIYMCFFSAVIVFVTTRYEIELNAAGLLLRDQILGFKLYLSTAERYRLQNLTPETFEKYLPYAMIFGIEKKWAKAFETLTMPVPKWYAGNTGYVAGSVVGSPVSFSASSFASSFSASFSSSFASSGAGGGFSGGGGGAGGGGGGGGGGAS